MKMTCPNCGKLFIRWRAKVFCSEKCRKISQNSRLRRYGESDKTNTSSAKLGVFQTFENIEEKNVLRRDDSLQWVACNEITQKLGNPGVGYVTLVEDRGWFGRVKDERGNFAFGPSSKDRAKMAVEAWVHHAFLEKKEKEKSWIGDLGDLTGRSVYSYLDRKE